MLLKHYNTHLEIEEDSYVWRYMNYSKLSTLIFHNELYFTRIDCFEDPMEGLDPELLFKLYHHNLYRYYKTEELKEITNSPNFVVTNDQVNSWKRSCFVSCWFLTETSNNDKQNGKNNHDESFSQWHLYCDRYSFAIKVSFKTLLSVISNALKDFEDSEIKFAKYGKIEYLNLYETTRKNAEMKKPYMPSFIKHKSYCHEKELRFSLNREQGGVDKKGIQLDLKEELNKIKSQIEIIAHPDMDISFYSMLKKEFNKVGYELFPSKLITKNNIQYLISV